MSLAVRSRREIVLPAIATLAVLIVSGCSSTGDFGRLRDDLATDDIHAWVGRDVATAVGAPVSQNDLTDDERTLRDLAFPLIEPPYDRQRWDAVLYEYGYKQFFRRELWAFDTSAYYTHLQATYYGSTTVRYNRLVDDIRNDIVGIDPFFEVARRVVDLDRRREQSMRFVGDLSPAERNSALARVGENSLIIAWVHHSLTERCASYRFALNHLVVAEPDSVAAEAERVLRQMEQEIAANKLVPGPRFAALPARMAMQEKSVTQ
jgi:hypothetical protein